MPTKPTNYPRWADGGSGTPTNQIAPLSAQQDSGWTPGKLGAQVLNWLLYTIYTWILYFDGVTQALDRWMRLILANPVTSTVGAVLWNGVAANGSTLVAVGNGGVVAKSTDNGVTWTTGTSGDSNNLIGVAYANGVWCAIGINTLTYYTYTSPDGVTWTQHASPTGGGTDYLFGIAGSSSVFVLASSSGHLYSSTDGATWTLRKTATTFNVVRFVNGLFVAAGSTSQQITSSPDGVTWTDRGVPPHTVEDLTWSTLAALYLIVGTDGTHSAASSAAALTGTWTTTLSIGSSGNLIACSHEGGGFIAIGLTTASVIHFSIDGQNWKTISSSIAPVPSVNSHGYLENIGSRLYLLSSSSISRFLALQ